MAFEVGDEVVYDGSLGKHNGAVAAVNVDGSVDVSVPGLPDWLRTDEASLFGRYAKGGPIPAGPLMVTNTTDSVEMVTPAGFAQTADPQTEA